MELEDFLEDDAEEEEEPRNAVDLDAGEDELFEDGFGEDGNYAEDDY